jgi:alkaline phosphatase D
VAFFINSKEIIMRNILCFILLILICSCKSSVVDKSNKNDRILQIGFGSCQNQTVALPLLSKISDSKLDFFIYLGDNIYSDTYDIKVLEKNYEILNNNKDFKNLKKTTPLYATWDDHDYGYNDKGRHYPLKAESKKLFVNFWNIPQDSNRNNHDGIYGSDYFTYGNKKIQLIYLDTRTFRDDLLLNNPKNTAFKNDYIPNQNTDSTFLGRDQWNWLEKELSQKADLRIIASSNQFSHTYNGYESWTNVPHEQQKFINLIAKTKANGVLFISGDVHWGEISKMNTSTTYPIFDITSSGITQTWPSIEPNENRLGVSVPQNNYGIIKFYYEQKDPTIEMELLDINGSVNKQIIKLSDIEFKP